MAKNFILADADTVEMVSARIVKSGEGEFIGAVFGVALVNAASGVIHALRRKGAVELPKKAALVIADGETVGFDESAQEVVASIDVNSNGDIGQALLAAVGSDALASVILNS